MLEKSFKDLISAFQLWHVWFYQAYHVITAKYKRTALGTLWISGSMIATSLSLSILFGGLFGQTLKEALPMIMAGILCFSFAGFPLNEGQEALIGNGGIIKNHAYPFTYYILESVAKNLLMFAHNLVVFYLAMLIIGAAVIPHWTILPALFMVFIFMFTWSTITALAAARYRDLRFLLPYIGQLLSVLTPVFWRAELLHGPRRLIADLNPVYGILEIVRAPLLGHSAPFNIWVLASIATFSGVLVWLLTFPVFRKRIPFWV